MKRLQLSTLKDGARFVYGGVEWVKLEHLYTESGKLETVAIAAEPVFERAFDEENCNDWRKSSLRRELNGPFLDTLIAEGADPAASYSYGVRIVTSSGAESRNNAYNGYRGVRPLCHLESSIFVSVPDEEGMQMNRGEAIEEARDAVLDTLNDYPADIWGDVLGAAVASLFQSKQDAADMAEEEKASREISTTETEPPEGIF